MSYLQDKKNRQNKFIKITIAAFALLVVFYFRAGIFGAVSFVGISVFRPVLTAGSSVGGAFGNLGAYFSSKRSLYAENEELKQKLEARNILRSDYDVLASENEGLKKIMWRLPDNRELTLAAILLKPNRSPYDTLVIDLGAEDGTEAGDMVYAYGNIPIGRVASVENTTSKVILFSSPGEKTEVAAPSTLSGSDHGDIFWEIIGRGGGNFEMILPRDFALEKGNAVVLPGMQAFTVAVAETILSDPRSPWKTALLKSPANIQEIKFVQVEIKP